MSGIPAKRAFTLIELMAVVVVILALAAIGMGVAGYVQKKVNIATTKSQIAAIEAALEAYRSDWGYYPLTFEKRLSTDGSVELTNNATLYRALFTRGKRYLVFPATQVRTDLMSTYVMTGAPTYIFDIFGKPFNYYNSPATPFSVGVNLTSGGGSIVRTNPCTLGGQMNRTHFDLFSYGPDKYTYSRTNLLWANPAHAIDDLRNWEP
ncbi:MAG: hypothetical protein PCFJNLEI_02433 [Verrucomicrobiae bacterium]|nr:hypothetical protein [Verrucomicrobiae bacterium]